MYKIFVATFTAMLVTAAASMLMAQEREPRMEMMHKGMQMMKNMDADENGEISREEFVMAHEEMFDSMDRNGDGALDQEEQMTMMQKMQHHGMEEMDHHEMKMQKPNEQTDM